MASTLIHEELAMRIKNKKSKMFEIRT